MAEPIIWVAGFIGTAKPFIPQYKGRLARGTRINDYFDPKFHTGRRS